MFEDFWEQLANTAATQGIPPPPMPVNPPGFGVDDFWQPANRVGTPPLPVIQPATLPQPMPPMPPISGSGALPGPTLMAPPSGEASGILPISPTAATMQPAASSTDMSAMSKPNDPMGRLAAALKGVKAPPAPDIPKVGTPAAPRPIQQIKTGELLALLQMLSGGGGKTIMPLGGGGGGRG